MECGINGSFLPGIVCGSVAVCVRSLYVDNLLGVIEDSRNSGLELAADIFPSGFVVCSVQ